MTAQLAYSLRALFSAKRGTAVILGNCIVGRWQPRSTSLRSYKINHKNTPVTDRGYTDDISEVTTADCKEYRIYPKIFQTLIKHFYLKIKLITLLKCLINNPNLGVIFASLTMLHCDDYCHCDEKTLSNDNVYICEVTFCSFFIWTIFLKRVKHCAVSLR